MKKIITAFSLLLTFGFTSIAASPVTPDPRIEKKFQKEFAGAEHVKWMEDDGYIGASFILGGQRTLAWFSKEGELVGSVRGISYSQLPMLVTRSLHERFPKAVLIEMREVTNSDGTRYKLVLENNNRKYKVSILPDGSFDEKERLK